MKKIDFWIPALKVVGVKISTLFRVDLNMNSNELHQHSREFEFHYIIKGSGVFQNGSRKHSFSNDTLFLTPPGTLHSLDFASSAKEIFYYCSLFRPEKSDQALISLVRKKFRKGYLHIGAHHCVYFDDIRRKIFSEAPFLHRSGIHQFYSFLYELAEGKPGLSEQQNVYVEAAIRLMRDRETTVLNLTTLSQKLGLNKSYFIRLFRQKMGITPLQYFIRLKMETARHLLKHSSLPIYAIAKHLHFADEFHFSRMFKKNIGVAPRIFRAGIQRAFE